MSTNAKKKNKSTTATASGTSTANNQIKQLLISIQSLLTDNETKSKSTVYPDFNAAATANIELLQSIQPLLNQVIELQQKPIEQSKQSTVTATGTETASSSTAAVDPLLSLSNWLLTNAPNSLINKTFTFRASSNPDEGNGVIALKPLAAGEQFMSIPRSIMLTTDTAAESAVGKLLIADPIINKMPSLLLAIHLLFEKQNNTSFWAPYISILPTEFNIPLFASLTELTELQYSPLLYDITNLHKATIRQYIHLYTVLNKAGFLSIASGRTFTYKQFLWAIAAVMTRQNKIPAPNQSKQQQQQQQQRSVIALIPGWDLCNHRSLSGEIRSYLNPITDSNDSFTCTAVNINEPIYIFYGERSNSLLFMYSGFIDYNNKYDTMDYTLSINSNPDTVDELFKLKKLLLSKAKMDIIHLFKLPLPDHPIEPIANNIDDSTAINNNLNRYLHLMHFCRLAVLNNKSDAGIVLKSTAVNQSNYLIAPINETNERDAILLLQTQLIGILKHYSTTADQDIELLNNNNRTNISRIGLLIIEYRLTEKRLLATAIAKCQHWLEIVNSTME